MATLSSKRNVRVLYDYTYEEKDGSRGLIKAGEECILVKKTDDDWWLILHRGQKNGIFVPANHLQEIHKTTVVVGSVTADPPKVKPKPAKPPPVPKKPIPPLVEDDVLKEFDNMLEHALDGVSGDRLNELPPDCGDDKAEQVKPCDNSAGEDVEYDAEYINVAVHKAATDANANSVTKRDRTDNYENTLFNSDIPQDAADESDPDYENVSAELPQYANLRDIQKVIRRRSQQSADCDGPQQPKEGATADQILVGGWEQHSDEEGVIFYFNPATKQSQWKPPSGVRVSCNGDQLSLSHRSLQKMTPGWTEEHSDTGTVQYVNDFTKERWQSSVDASGRRYYFRENSSGESSWELPEVCPVVKSRPSSLRVNLCTARNLLTKHWRRSSWSSGSQQHVVTPSCVQAVASTQVSNIYNLNAVDVAERSDTPEADGASSPSSPRAPTSDCFDGDSGCRPVPMRLKELKGTLNKKKLMENNKKLKKNWSQSYVVTTGQMLYFYKDQKFSNPKPNQPFGKPEVMIDLRDAEIKFGSDLPCSKKNLFTIKTVSGRDEYLLQCEIPTEIHEWFQTLSGNITSLVKCIDRPTTLPRQRSIDLMPSSDTNRHTSSNETLTRKKERLTQTIEKMTNHTGNLSINEEADNSRRIRDWLGNWFKRRPAVETLRAKGIMKDVAFGSTLISLCALENSKVPHFVTRCIEAIECRGLANDGIYRVSGNLAEIQTLKFCVNQDNNFDLVSSEFDLHVLTGALKMFFRELKEPLFPFNMFDKFMAAIKMQSKSKKAQMFRDLIQILPSANKETMRTLFEHLLRVTDCSRENRMQIQNIAIVFGPTLLSPEFPSQNITVTLVLQSQIVDFILHEFKRLF